MQKRFLISWSKSTLASKTAENATAQERYLLLSGFPNKKPRVSSGLMD